MEQDTQETIVEQEVGQITDLLTTWLLLVTDWIHENILTLASIWQIAALAATLALALLFRRSFRRLLDKLGNERALGPIVQRLVRTVAAIALPVCWAIGLWIVTAVFEALGLPISLMRLVGSLLIAFIVIGVASIFIPSAYWSSVFAWVAWAVAALNAVGVLDPVIEWMQATGMTIGGVTINLWAVVKGLMLTAILIWAATAVSEAVTRRLDAAQSMTPAMRLLISKILRMVLIFIAVIIGLTAVGVDLTVFAVFSGALGIGVGLGLQQTVGNLFASFSLLADRSVQPGDVVEIETPQGATYGRVNKMTTRYVSVRTRDNTATLVPNQMMIANPVTNWSYGDKKMRLKAPIGVSYDTDLDRAIALCIEAAAVTDRVLEDPKPVCLLRGFGDNSVDLEIRFWIVDPENGVANVTSAVLMNTWHRFRKAKIEIPFPQRDLHLRSAVPLVVQPPEPADRKG